MRKGRIGGNLSAGQQWLLVADNGVGMTEEVTKKQFTADRQELLPSLCNGNEPSG